MSANERQVGGNHYLREYQHWDIVNDFGLDYFQGQITKYVMRWRDKGGVQDLRKAQHFLAKYIELQALPDDDGGLGLTAEDPGPEYVNQD